MPEARPPGLARIGYAVCLTNDSAYWKPEPMGQGLRYRQAQTRPRPEDEWIVTELPELRIVPQELWDRVKARQAEQRAKSEHVRKALHKNARTGAGPKYLFSGLLKCAECGANYVQADSYRYACSTHVLQTRELRYH